MLDAESRLEHRLGPGRRAYVHVAKGSVKVNGETLSDGDAVAIDGASVVLLEGVASAEVLLFDLP